MKPEEALEQIAYVKGLLTKTRMRAAYGYPFFIIWGAYSVLGYLGAILRMYYHWAPLAVAAGIVSVAAGLRMHWPGKDTRLLRHLGRQFLILLLADSLLFAVLIHLKASAVVTAYWPFQIGVIYMAAGVFIGRDLTGIGAGIAAAAAASLLIPDPFKSAWLAVFVGGGLIVTGMVLRNQVKKVG